MLPIMLQVAAVLPVALDLGAKPGDVRSWGAASASVVASAGDAGESGDAALGGVIRVSVGVGPRLEILGELGGNTPITLGMPEDPTSDPETHGVCNGQTLRGLVNRQGVHATSLPSSDKLGSDARIGARWGLPGGTFALRGDLLPASGGGELRVEAWRSLGRWLAVTAYTGYRARDAEDGMDSVTWGGAAHVPVVAGLHAVAGFEGEAGIEGEWIPAHAVGGLRWDVGAASLYALGGAGVGEDRAADWQVGIGATFSIGRGVSRAGALRAREPAPALLYAVVSEEEEPLVIHGSDDRIEAELLGSDIDRAFRSVVVTIEHDEIVLAEPIYFDRDRKRVKHRFHDALSSLAAFLGDHPEIAKVRIHGHADETGPEDWNDTLSALRAEEVARQLVARGVSPDRLEVAGFGSRVPDAPNDTEEGRARNRRVVFLQVR